MATEPVVQVPSFGVPYSIARRIRQNDTTAGSVVWPLLQAALGNVPEIALNQTYKEKSSGTLATLIGFHEGLVIVYFPGVEDPTRRVAGWTYEQIASAVESGRWTLEPAA